MQNQNVSNESHWLRSSSGKAKGIWNSSTSTTASQKEALLPSYYTYGVGLPSGSLSSGKRQTALRQDQSILLTEATHKPWFQLNHLPCFLGFCFLGFVLVFACLGLGLFCLGFFSWFIYKTWRKFSQPSRACKSAWRDQIGLSLNDFKGTSVHFKLFATWAEFQQLHWKSLSNAWSLRWVNTRMTSNPNCTVSDLAQYSILTKARSNTTLGQKRCTH